jgi:hypothetical protein
MAGTCLFNRAFCSFCTFHFGPIQARFRLGVGVKNYGGQYGVQWACSGPSAWNKIYVSCTVPTFVCKLVGANLRANLKSTCVYSSPLCKVA